MEFKKIDKSPYFAGRFYCTKIEYKNFLVYVDLMGQEWKGASTDFMEQGYPVYPEEVETVKSFIKLMEENEIISKL